MLQIPDFTPEARADSCSTFNASMVTWDQFLETTKPFQRWCTADLDYALSVVYFSCGLIGLFILAHAVSLVWARKQKGQTRSPSRVISLFRVLSSRQFTIRALGWYSPPLGIILIGALMVAFVFALLFSDHKFFWENINMGDSPPLGTRGGWVSLAMMPFSITFATKYNPITIFTGTSHEKLQVYHRWSAWLMYFAGLIHTFPFIVYNIRWGIMEAMYNSSAEYWTGIACLIPMTWLVFMSIGPIRNFCYEFFKKMHLLAAAFFVTFFFIHCAQTLTSWNYFYATFAIYVVSFFARVTRLVPCFDAQITPLPYNTIKVSIPVHSHLNWTPGQHFFVRFIGPGLGPHNFSSHPFTVASVPRSGEDGLENVVEFFVRGHRGITGRLQKIAEMEKGKRRFMTVVLDGPYGGLPAAHGVKGFDRVLLLAGGSGATFTLPAMTDLARAMSLGSQGCRKIDFVLAAPTYDSIAWCDTYLNAAKELLAASDKCSTLSVSIYITRQPDVAPSTLEDAEEGKESIDCLKGRKPNLLEGRPALADIIRTVCEEEKGNSIAVVCCGPGSFSYDARNAVAACELDIARGKFACSELYLHTESYSW